MRRVGRKSRRFQFVLVGAAILGPCVLAFLIGRADLCAAAEDTRRITLEGSGVTIEYRSSDEKAASEVAEICRNALPSLSRELGLGAVKPFHIFLIPDIRSYEERMRLALPAWGIAFAFAGNQMMVVDVGRATREWDSLEKVIPHELSHMLLAQKTGGVPIPLWFVEGLAQRQAREWSVVESWRLMEAIWMNRAPGLGRIVYTMPADESLARDAYRVSYAAVQYRFGEHAELLPGFLEEVVRQADFEKAFEKFWNESETQFYARFADHLGSEYKSRLMIFQTGPLFTILSVLFLAVVFRIWLRNRRKLKRMEKAEREWPGSWER